MASAALPTAAAITRASAHGGSWRSGLQTGLFAALVVTGLWIWLRPGDGAVVLVHLAGGVALTSLLAGWLWRHVPSGRRQSQRRVFSGASWALLASWLILTASGLALALPGLLWLMGLVWFPGAALTSTLSFLHLWASFVAAAGLILHLGQRHWVWRRR